MQAIIKMQDCHTRGKTCWLQSLLDLACLCDSRAAGEELDGYRSSGILWPLWIQNYKCSTVQRGRQELLTCRLICKRCAADYAHLCVQQAHGFVCHLLWQYRQPQLPSCLKHQESPCDRVWAGRLVPSGIDHTALKWYLLILPDRLLSSLQSALRVQFKEAELWLVSTLWKGALSLLNCITASGSSARSFARSPGSSSRCWTTHFCRTLCPLQSLRVLPSLLPRSAVTVKIVTAWEQAVLFVMRG